jgi:hypothetical protein
MDVANITAKGYVVAILNISKDFIPWKLMLGVVHLEDIHNNHINYLCLSISLEVKGSWFGQVDVHH